MMYFVDGAELMVETDSPALNVYKYIEFHCRWISLSYYNRMPLLQQASLWHFFPPEYSTINNQQSAERYSDKPAWYKNLNPFFIYWLKVYSPYLEQSEYSNTGNCVLVHLKNKRKQNTHTHTHKLKVPSEWRNEEHVHTPWKKDCIRLLSQATFLSRCSTHWQASTINLVYNGSLTPCYHHPARGSHPATGWYFKQLTLSISG